jgi:hypothetical protein
MPGTIKVPAMVALLALGLAGCNQADQANGGQPGTSRTGQAAALKPGSEPQKEAASERAGAVALLRVPNGGIQPQAVADPKGTLHLIYFKGDNAGAGDLFYVRREAGTERFSDPMRINSRPASACAIGSVRGGQVALGKGGRRLHVVWNGKGTEYARLNDSGTAFEEQRDLMRQTQIPDGGGTVAADEAGNVYVIWHGIRNGEKASEDTRKVWVARSQDEGKTFSMEAPAWTQPTGVCACCSTRAFADHKGAVYLLYRSATAKVNRDIYLLSSLDEGKSFQEALVHKWRVPG